MDSKIYYCMSCGGPLNIQINRPFVFCQFCGCKNEIISQKMQTTINVGNVKIEANTNLESMLNSAEYAVSIGQYDKANELLLAAVMSGVADYRIYILKAQIDLLQDDNKSLFEDIRKLQQLERTQSDQREVTIAVCELMRFRGKNGVTVLHNATFHELMDMVVYCVEHNSDVNCIAGMNRVTPISIMFVNISPNLSRLDGTPFIRNKQMVINIRNYLMYHGARDVFRLGY